MPRKCTICSHGDRRKIEKALVAYQPFRAIADRFNVSKTSLMRHHDDHLPTSLVKARDAQEVANADAVLGHATDLRDRALAILEKAEKADDLRTALMAIREARESVRLLGELAGKLQAGSTVNVILSPEWMQVQAIVLGALEPYHDARTAVAGALKEVGHA